MDNGAIATVEGESKDWINKLPDCVLSSILSLLKIKDAAEASSVSRSWRNLWSKTRPPNLELDIPNIFGSSHSPLPADYDECFDLYPLTHQFDRECYIKRVNQVLELYSANKLKLDSFKVVFFLDRQFTEQLDKWVRFAITKGVQKLDLILFRGYYDEFYNNFYVFPHWILADLKASTLKHLSLYRCVLKPPANYDRFMELRSLHLRDVEVDPHFLAHLSSACVLLESFTLNRCMVRSNLIIGPLLHLHDLKLLCCGLERLEIDAVNLSCLEYGIQNIPITLIRTPNLVRVYCKGWRKDVLLPNLLTKPTLCRKLEALHLYINEVENIPQAMPTLGNLKQLNLDLLPGKFDLGSLLNILKAAPLLEELTISTRVYGYYGEMRKLSTFSHKHLRRFKMQGFQGMWFEIELAICILKIATELEVMVIDPNGSYYNGDGSCIPMPCRYQVGNEFENEIRESYDDSDEDENVDNVPDELFRWQKRGRAVVQERLKDVKTNAQVIICNGSY